MSSGNHSGGWSEPEFGSIDGHPVIFSSGTGSREGQTLIADLHDDIESDEKLAKEKGVGDDDSVEFPSSSYHSNNDDDFFHSSNHNHYGSGNGYNNNARDNGSYTGPNH